MIIKQAEVLRKEEFLVSDTAKALPPPSGLTLEPPKETAEEKP